MNDTPYICLPIAQLPRDPEWLQNQSCPVIAVGEGEVRNADVIVVDENELGCLTDNIERTPMAATTLVQVLRVVEQLPVPAAITVESLAYASLQGGAEFQSWLTDRNESPRLVTGHDNEPVVTARHGNIVRAELNRAEHRNSLTVEMRDALVELFELLLTDTSIERLELSARGGCFSIGGDLREFGLSRDTASAHRVRSTHNPSRLLARCASRVSCHLHSACVGSGIEIPAFAHSVTAAANSFFQLPELQFGLVPGAGGCVSISRRVGRQRTAWLALSGKRINARQALQWGLIDAIAD